MPEIGTLVDPTGGARSAMSELVVACKALPDFDTLQVVHVTAVPMYMMCWCGWVGCGSRMPGSSERQEEVLRGQTESMKYRAMDCLKKSETECQGEERERKKTTLRVFMFGPGCPCHSSGKVEEYEV